ncbi:MAG: hypothetical protein ACK55I_02885, partial [bacterium]
RFQDVRRRRQDVGFELMAARDNLVARAVDLDVLQRGEAVCAKNQKTSGKTGQEQPELGPEREFVHEQGRHGKYRTSRVDHAG